MSKMYGTVLSILINSVLILAAPLTQQHFVDAIRSLQSREITQTCLVQLEEYSANLNLEEDSWALAMLDATSKLPSGLLSLNFAEMGNFDQCINIKTNQTRYKEITGKYCLGFIGLTQTTNEIKKYVTIQKRSSSLGNLADLAQTDRAQGPTWAICLPDGCSSSDANVLVNFLMQTVTGDAISIQFSDLFCQTLDDTKADFSNGAVATLVILGTLLFLILMSTLYDFYCIATSKEPLHTLLIGFSLYSNGKKVFKLREASADQLPCLDGLKFISMMWVVSGHQFSIPVSGPLSNTKDLIEWADSLRSMVLISGTLSVDTFLVIGASLMAYGFMKAKSRKIPFNIFLYYLHRYLRLTPALAFVVLISSTMLRYMASGPKWPLAKLYFQDNCVDYWWSTLLYVQNYVNVTRMCVGQTWYLSIDMQLYLISPAIFFLLWKYPKICLSLVSGCILVTIALSFYSAWSNELTAILSNIYGNSDDYSNKYYLLTHTRAGPWFIGVIVGYILYKIKYEGLRFRPNKVLIMALWVVSLATLLSCVFGGFDTLRSKEYDRWGNALHITLVRPVWTLAISWVILACTLNYGGPINWILSLPIYQVLNRFTYGIYLTHVTMLYLMVFAKKSPDYFSEFNSAYQFWGTWWFSTGLATLLVFMVESPMIVIEKMIFSKANKVRRENLANSSFDNLGIYKNNY